MGRTRRCVPCALLEARLTADRTRRPGGLPRPSKSTCAVLDAWRANPNCVSRSTSRRRAFSSPLTLTKPRFSRDPPGFCQRRRRYGIQRSRRSGGISDATGRQQGETAFGQRRRRHNLGLPRNSRGFVAVVTARGGDQRQRHDGGDGGPPPCSPSGHLRKRRAIRHQCLPSTGVRCAPRMRANHI